jgi:hypothetical protein
MKELSFNCISNAIKTAKDRMVAESMTNDGDYVVISIKGQEEMTPIFTMFCDGKRFIQTYGKQTSRPAVETIKKTAKGTNPDSKKTPATTPALDSLKNLCKVTSMNVRAARKEEDGTFVICCMNNETKRYTIAYLDNKGGVSGFLKTKDNAKVRTFVAIPKTMYEWNIE